MIFLYKIHDSEWLLAMFHHKNENIIGIGIFFSCFIVDFRPHCEDPMTHHMQKTNKQKPKTNQFEPIQWICKYNSLKNVIAFLISENLAY